MNRGVSQSGRKARRDELASNLKDLLLDLESEEVPYSRRSC